MSGHDLMVGRSLRFARKLLRLTLLGICLAAMASSTARGVNFDVRGLSGLQWWANAVDSQLAQNPDGTGTVGSGDPVGFISDLSGNGHNAVMGNAIVANGDAFRPLFETNLLSGSPGILFDGQTTFSSLQSSLFNGATSLSLAFAIEAANSSPSNQYIFGSNSAAVGFLNSGNPYGGVQLNNGQSIGLFPTSGFSLNGSEGSDTMMTVIARFQPRGESDLWENGVLVSSTFANFANPFIQSPTVKLLGNLSSATAASSVSASSSTAAKFYFLEGLASTSAVSNAQVSQLNNYFLQKWPGVEDVSSSPNLYWDKSQNPQRAVATTVNAGHIQGVAVGDNWRFVFHTTMIEEYDSNWQLITNNQSISTGIVSAGTSFHCGDGDYAQGKVFAPLEQDLNGAGAAIGVYDATKPGLPLIAYKSLSTPQHEMSGLTVVPTAGGNGIIYVSSFEANSGGGQLWMYDYSGGNVTSPDFGSFLGTMQIPTSVQGIQGVAYKAPYFYFSDGQNSTIQRVLYQNGVLAAQAQLVWTAPTTVQGLGFDGANLLQVLQSGSTTEYAWTLTSSKFATSTTTGIGSWNLSGDGTYGGNLGFDPIVPNGPGSMAYFGGGTKNTVTAPTVNVTIDGAYTVGSLVFNPPTGTSYTLASDGVTGDGLTLDSGNGGGASVTVSSGSHMISANLVLADSGGTTFNIASGSALTVSGVVSESGGSQSLTLSSGGTVTFASANSYSGGTTISSGTLQTIASGALGSGPLAVSAAAGANSALVLGGSEAVSGLSGTVAPNGTAVINIAPGASLTVNQPTNTTYQGTLMISGTFTKAGSGTLELNGPAVSMLGGTLQVTDSGTLRLNAATGAATIAGGAIVQVTGTAMLELAGSVSALSSSVSAASRAGIVNDSAAPAGVLVSGTNQQVGGIDGTGNVVVNSGSDLTADHIVQNALVVGGSPGNPAIVTIAASDSDGNPSSETDSTPALRSGLTLAGSLASAASSPTDPDGSQNANWSAGSPNSARGLTDPRLAMAEGQSSGIGNLNSVPEPSAVALTVYAVFPTVAVLRRRFCRRPVLL